MISVPGSNGGGGGNAVILDGVEYKGELKLSTEYQWIEQSTLPSSASNGNGSKFISYEDELYWFQSSFGVYKLNGISWEKIMSHPDGEIHYPVIVDNKLLTISKSGVYEVDTTQLSFTKIVDLPSDANSIPIGAEYQGKLNIVYEYLMDSKKTYPHYELDGTTWTKISEVPTDVYFHDYYAAIGEFNDELHILGGNRASTLGAETHIKLSGTSWVKDIPLPHSIGADNILIEHDNIYAIYHADYYMLRLKDGAFEEFLHLSDRHKNGNLVRHKGVFHLLGGNPDAGYRKTTDNHFALKKVLCLED